MIRDDLIRAVDLLAPLGTGFCIIPGATPASPKILSTVPHDLNMDLQQVITLLETLQMESGQRWAWTTLPLLSSKTGWTPQRVELVLVRSYLHLMNWWIVSATLD
jgi:hypothetical protein